MTAPAEPRDRRELLLEEGASFNGIDYVEVASVDQTRLRVHFINAVTVNGTLSSTAPPVTITGGETIESVPVNPVDDGVASPDWTVDGQGRPILTVVTAFAGDFSYYQLAVLSPVLDPYFASVTFSFKANCPSDLDCAPSPAVCPPMDDEIVPINYLAKDFASFNQALSDFSALRYPGWQERSEADVGTMLMEVLAAIADELSYYQDRIAREATLRTATQRVSLLRHARLVDYEPCPQTVARTLLQLDVSGGPLTDPLRVQAALPDGSTIDFEVGDGLADPNTGEQNAIDYAVDPQWNRYDWTSTPKSLNLAPYWWDDSQQCLLPGSTDFWVMGHGRALTGGQQLLLDTAAATTADPPVREIVIISSAEETVDPVLAVDLTHVVLQAPTVAEHDLTRTEIAGNLVPAIQGTRVTEQFVIPGGSDPLPNPPPRSAITRVGANWQPSSSMPDYLYSLAATSIAWVVAEAAADETVEDVTIPARPELVLTELAGTAPGSAWLWSRWLLDAGASERAFTLSPEKYSPVLTSGPDTWWDYDGEGATIRFGDSVFGVQPAPGTIFEVTYRTGVGAIGNVPSDTVTSIVAGQPAAAQIFACTNPFPATGGADEESAQQIKDRAPAAFRARPLRVVRPSDYVAAAQELSWVQQAGSTFRWSGSWLSVVTTANPVGSEEPAINQLGSLTELLDRRRLAGYESFVLPPRYVSVDLQITVCGSATAFAGDVEAAVLARLRPGLLPSGGTGFFDHSRWTFGAPLDSSALRAAIQSCPGVAGVFDIDYRRRGLQVDWAPIPDVVLVDGDHVLRLDDDPSRPEAGTLHVTVKGSK